MSARYEELIAAGAPRLPEGYYYKVYDWVDDQGRAGLNVSVRRERVGWFDKRLAATSSYSSQIVDVADLGRMCRIAWSKAEGNKLRKDLRPFLGRHP